MMECQFQKFVLQFIILGVLTAGICAQTQLEQETIKKIFEGQQYDRSIRPGKTGEGLNVSVNFYVRSIDKLENGDFHVQLTFRQQWVDERLKYKADMKYVNMKPNPEPRTWVPDTFFSNEKEGHIHGLMVPNEYTRVFPDGEVLQSTRISLKLSCPMNYIKFPFDRQTCSIRLASYGYTTENIIYMWKKVDPIQVTSSLSLENFRLEQFSLDHCDSQTNTGVYSCLRADFLFKRAFNWYLINVYIPCTTFVIMAFFAFWIDAKHVTARTVLLVVTLVVMESQIATMGKEFPKANHTRPVDVWTGICLTFVFGALLEFIVVQHLARRQQKQESCNNASAEEQAPLKDTENDTGVTAAPQGSKVKCVFHKYICDSTSLPDKIDGACRVIFPILFALFIVVYFISYCPSSTQDCDPGSNQCLRAMH